MILLLFFLILLLLVFSYLRNADLDRTRIEAETRAQAVGKQNADFKERIERLQIFFDRIVEQLPESKRGDVADTLVAMDKLRAELIKMNDQKSVMEKEVLALEELIEHMSKKFPIAQVPDALKKEIGDLALCKNATMELPAARKRAKELEIDNGNMRGIAKEATDKAARCSGKGAEFVACWRDPDSKRVQAVFDVFLEGGAIRVVRKWPGSRDSEMERFPQERALVGRTVKLDEFMNETKSIAAQSTRDSCRHYVQFNGERAKMNPSMFAQFIRIQDHFYPIENIK
jgi:hypothetical protein